MKEISVRNNSENKYKLNNIEVSGNFYFFMIINIDFNWIFFK